MNRQKLIHALQGTCIAAVVVGASATLAPAEEVASIANPSVANSSVAKPPPSGAIVEPQPASPPGGRPIKRGARMAGPSSANLPPATFKLPGDYAVLNNRSIFARDGQAAAASTGPAKPEEMLAVRGIVSDEKSYFVFIEDTASHRMMQLRPGDAVGSGKVGHICMDDFNFETAGSSKRICVGQNLLGAAVPPVAPAAPQPPGPDQAKPEGPAKNAKPTKEPVPDAGPNRQPVRNLVAERAG